MTKAKGSPQVQYFDSAAFVADKPVIAEPSEPIIDSTAKPVPGRWRRWLFVALVVIALLLIGEATVFVYQAWQQHWLLGAAWTFAVGSVVLVAGGWVIREWWLVRKLRLRWQQRDQLQLQANDFRPEQLLPQLGHPDLYAHWAQLDKQGLQSEEQLQLFEQEIVVRVDQQVERIISDHALQSALLVAVSPIALLDASVMLWRNQRMVSAIARCYGLQLGYWSRIRLWRQLAVNVIGIGVTEVAIDLSTSWLDASVASKLSARAGQGVAAGLLTARLGLQAQKICRPLAFQHTPAPRLSAMRKTMIHRLMSQVPQFWRAESLSETDKPPVKEPVSSKVEK